MSEMIAGRISLSDDGTMDTVLTCACGQELRYTYPGCEVQAHDPCDCYDRFVDWAIEDAEAAHECIRTES